MLHVIESQRRILELDLATQRVLPEDVSSILAFCNFFQSVVGARQVEFVSVPMEQSEFYRKIIKRLVQAEELSAEISNLFDRAFPVSSSAPPSEAAKRDQLQTLETK